MKYWIFSLKEKYIIVGIYCIENIINNKKYVGQSINVEKRLKKHFLKLKNGEHENRYLQRSYNKHGENNFTSYLIEECTKEELNNKEIYWIEKLNSYKEGFNLTIGGNGVTGWKADDEFKQHISEITSGEKNPNYGHKWTDEMKKRLSFQRKGKYDNADNPNSKKIICVETLIIYSTIKEAIVSLDLKNQSSISRCLKDKFNVSNGFHFVLYNEDIYQYLLTNQFEYLCECYRGKSIFADCTNKIFYRKYELQDKLCKTLNMTTRKVKSILKEENFIIDNIQYVLL
jgi:group I intron endonuclease